MLIAILIGVAVIVGFLIAVAMQPPDFTISRGAAMAAAPATIFEQINDFHKWQAWSPWVKLDPAAKNSFEGPAAGIGAGFSWAGNKKVGEGRMTILESRSYTLIRIKLEFFKPFAATNSTEFTFRPEGSQTMVSWSMAGKNQFMGKLMGLFMNCDKMVGRSFEEGLANMKAIVEIPDGG